MEFLPYQHFYIGTRLMYSELNKRLDRNIDTSIHLFEPFRPEKRYYGKLGPDGFSVHRWVDAGRHLSRNSVSLFGFPAVVAADFLEATNGEIIISLRLHLHWTGLPALLFWFLVYAFVFTILLGSFLADLIRQIPYPADLIIFLSFLSLILLCTYGTMMAFFERNARRDKQFFLELTEAYEVLQAR